MVNLLKRKRVSWAPDTYPDTDPLKVRVNDDLPLVDGTRGILEELNVGTDVEVTGEESTMEELAPLGGTEALSKHTFYVFCRTVLSFDHSGWKENLASWSRLCTPAVRCSKGSGASRDWSWCLGRAASSRRWYGTQRASMGWSIAARHLMAQRR